ncbi:MAG: hypothetical protein Q4A50_10225, partial [Bacteroidales bacterium]|nr:hypothetical protein [Bacteroidales bacterium]
ASFGSSIATSGSSAEGCDLFWLAVRRNRGAGCKQRAVADGELGLLFLFVCGCCRWQMIFAICDIL